MTLSDLVQRPRARLAAAALAAALAPAIILLPGCARNGAGRPAAGARAAMTVTTLALESSEVMRSVTANGSIHAWQEIIVGPEVGGYRVAAVHVDVGDSVRKGQELVRLADELLSADVASKRAGLEQAKAMQANAASAFRRAQSLSGSGAISASDIDRLRSEELAAQARVEVAQAELETADLRLRYSRVLAPDDGVVSARTVSIGEIAQAGSEMLRLLRKGRVEWRAEIPESRLLDIEPGQAVRLTTADGTQLEGKVRVVAPTVQSTTRSGLVYVDLDSASGARPGMFARGEILLKQASAHLVPLASVVIQDGYSYVFVLKDGNLVERRHVQTGVVEGNSIEIVSGLAQGEHIVEQGAGFLKDGDRVNVVAAQPEQPS